MGAGYLGTTSGGREVLRCQVFGLARVAYPEAGGRPSASLYLGILSALTMQTKKGSQQKRKKKT